MEKLWRGSQEGVEKGVGVEGSLRRMEEGELFAQRVLSVYRLLY